LEALKENPELEPMFLGERVDYYFRQAFNGSMDPALDRLMMTARGVFGPDVFNPFTGAWWDVTTQQAWAAHYATYSVFGANGSPLLYSWP
jgi:hypothetical protein